MNRPGLMFFVVCFTLLSCFTASRAEMQRASLQPLWIPQSQFAGYMVALEKGYYREEGIDLTLLKGGPGRDPLKMVVNRRATFGIGWLASAMLRRAAGEPLVNIGQLIRESAFLIVARKSCGITKPTDLQNKRVALWVGDLMLQPTMAFDRQGICVEIVPNYTSMNAFLKGAVDATSAMWYNEYHTIINSGLNPDELTVLPLTDLNVDFPEDGLYCTEKTFVENPELCRGFVRASLKGWQTAFSDPEYALDIVMDYANRANTGTNRTHQRWMLNRMRDLIAPNDDYEHMGILGKANYDRLADMLKTHVSHDVPPYEVFYRGPR